jgi:hypothetical protein
MVVLVVDHLMLEQQVLVILRLPLQAKEVMVVLVAELLRTMAVAVAEVHLLSVAVAHQLLQEMVVQVQLLLFQALASHTLAVVEAALMVERLALAGQAAAEQVQHLIQLQPQAQLI